MENNRLVGKEILDSSYGNGEKMIETAKKCADWCQSTEECVAWVFFKSPNNTGDKYCDLMKSITCHQEKNPAWVSGVSGRVLNCTFNDIL